MCHICTSVTYVTYVYNLIRGHASGERKFMLVAILSLEFCGTWRTVKEIPPDQYQLWQEECSRKVALGSFRKRNCCPASVNLVHTWEEVNTIKYMK